MSPSEKKEKIPVAMQRILRKLKKQIPAKISDSCSHISKTVNKKTEANFKQSRECNKISIKMFISTSDKETGKQLC